MKFNFQFVFSIGIHKYIQTWMLNVWIALHNKLCCRNTAKWDDAQKCNNTIITIFFKISCTGTTRERAKQKFCLKVRHLFFLHNPREKTDYGIIKKDGRATSTSPKTLYTFSSQFRTYVTSYHLSIKNHFDLHCVSTFSTNDAAWWTRPENVVSVRYIAQK